MNTVVCLPLRAVGQQVMGAGSGQRSYLLYLQPPIVFLVGHGGAALKLDPATPATPTTPVLLPRIALEVICEERLGLVCLTRYRLHLHEYVPRVPFSYTASSTSIRPASNRSPTSLISSNQPNLSLESICEKPRQSICLFLLKTMQCSLISELLGRPGHSLLNLSRL